MGRKIVLTEEMKALLSGLTPFDAGEKLAFTPDHYSRVGIPEEYWPKYTICTLDKGKHIEVCRLFDNIKAAKWEDLNEFARKITLGWENLFDSSTGEEVEYKADSSGGCDKETFEKLPRVVRGSLLYKSREISGLCGGEFLGLG